MLYPKCIYQKSTFAKCTRLACLLSFASLFFESVPNAKGTNLLQKKFASLENKLDNVVKMLMEMKESVKKMKKP